MERRIALVVGISNYPTSPLKNPINDADSMSAVLAAHGFIVSKIADCSRSAFVSALADFSSALVGADVGFFFFAGHGVQIDSENFLIVTDTVASSKDAARMTSIPLNEVLKTMNDSGVGVKIVVLDACRSEPWKQSFARDGLPTGLASVSAPKGTIIGFATSPGETASDGTGLNGTYTAALLNHIADKDRPIEAVFKRVRSEVAAVTRGTQTTWEHTSLLGEFYLNMSISKAINDYSSAALADAKFVPETTTFAERTINALKSSSWYTQNPAVQSLNKTTVNELTMDEAFVVGRNICQAAEGSSSDAILLIRGFDVRTRTWNLAKARAILDGILFEVFFDSKGEPRRNFKADHIDDIFALRSVARLAPSFDFITKCLAEAGRKMLVPPNKEAELGVTITFQKDDDGSFKIDGIHSNGHNILSVDDSSSRWGDGIAYRRTTSERFKQRLGATLGVPTQQLKVTFNPPPPNKDKIFEPADWSIQLGR